MKEVNVIYWSSTGNTQEAMAEAVGAGVEEAGGKANVIEVSAADVSMLKDADSFALGASAMGDEELDAEMDDFRNRSRGNLLRQDRWPLWFLVTGVMASGCANG